ncbi:MAG: hypothetical protein JST89_13420 [Cyanobacteria bacterium SZAS-4]|nr:hypothetical protein [Cyanobacteria bacterium SZAS-4]
MNKQSQGLLKSFLQRLESSAEPADIGSGVDLAVTYEPAPDAAVVVNCMQWIENSESESWIENYCQAEEFKK